ncbi:MAG: YggT family protein [Betaproteobacteria bacterium]|nr:YggT family protein [Betaproteobacteria bacterium]
MMTQALQFLLETIFGLFVLAVLLRFYLQWARAPFHNPFSQFIAALTDFAVKPLRRIIPGLFGLDLASLLLAWLVEYVLLLALFGLGGLFTLKADPSVFIAIGFLATLKLVRISIYILLGAVFVQAILSWTNPHTPLAPLLNRLTEPFLRPLRRIVPPLANVDLSPLVLFIICELLLMVPLLWLENMAMRLA